MYLNELLACIRYSEFVGESPKMGGLLGIMCGYLAPPPLQSVAESVHS